MTRLIVVPNDPNKDPQTQFRQLASNGRDLELYTNNVLTKIIVDNTEPNTGSDESTTSTDYINLANFTVNFTINNPLCEINFNLYLKGNGFIYLVINNQGVHEIPFNFTNFNPLLHNKKYNLRNGSNQVSLKWKAVSGTISKANSTTNPGFNYIQVTSWNS